jgi:hypothetical protein
MPRGPTTFRQRDLAAAIKAVVQAGQKVARVEVGKDGLIKLVLHRGDEERPPEPAAGCNEWDEILK